MSIYEKAGKDVLIILVGNKYDLKSQKGVEVVSEVEINGLAEAHQITYFNASAKENYNITEIFVHIANRTKERMVTGSPDGLQINGEQKTGNNSGCCK